MADEAEQVGQSKAALRAGVEPPLRTVRRAQQPLDPAPGYRPDSSSCATMWAVLALNNGWKDLKPLLSTSHSNESAANRGQSRTPSKSNATLQPARSLALVAGCH